MSRHNDLLTALRQITRAIDLHSKQLAKETGLTSPQLLVLQRLEADGRAKPSDIAKSIHLSQATITSIVDRLEKAELVTRERNAQDRRVLEVVLLDAGRQKLREAPKPLQEGFLLAFQGLEDWEQSGLVASVQRLAAMMNAESIDAAPILEVGDLSSDEN